MKSTSLISFLWQNKHEILSQTLEHIELTVFSLLIAALIGITTAILLTRYKRWANGVIGLVNVIQTIPSIALLGFLLPFLGIGKVPAIIALFLYALLPIVRNTFTGIEEIDPAVREAAIGMGLSNWQLLWKVELPLALPTIFAGLRTASVINVGVATLSALIAAGGLGEFIFRGIQLNNPNMIFAGAIPASLLALAFDGGIGLIQKHVRKHGKLLMVILAVLLALYGVVKFWPGDNSSKLTGGFPTEFIQREDGLQGLFKTYDMQFDYVELDPGLMYKALENKSVDVISGFSTDGRIAAYHLKTLEDDQNYFPPYYAAPLVRNDLLKQYPQVRKALNALAGQLDNNTMQQLNYAVDEGKQSPEKVARGFLEKAGFHPVPKKEGEAQVVIGSKAFTENYILAYLFSMLIESKTKLTTDLKLGFGGTKLLMDAMKAGEVDLYPEYTGTGLLLLLKPPKTVIDSLMPDKDRVYHYVQVKSQKRFQFTWLKPLGFNNTFALMMRQKDAKQKGIHRISDLSDYLHNH